MILASITSCVPTSLIVCVAAYLIGAWVTAFLLGVMDWVPDYDYVCVFWFSLIWPLYCFVIGMLMLEEWCKESDTGRRCLAFVKSLFDFATLPFRPFSLGKKLAGCRRKKDGNHVK